jgi:hypothetical protein
MIKIITGTSLAIVFGLFFLGCAKEYQTYSSMGQASQIPGIDQIVNKNGSLTLQMKGTAYYGNLVFDGTKRFELNPLIKGVSGNAKGALVASNGHVITCVMELQEETKSGSGYCLEDDNPKLLKIHLVTMQ